MSSRRVPGISLFPGGYDPDSNTMLLLKLDEGLGSIVVDYSDQANHGQITGAQWVPGRYGYGLYFDAINDSLVIPHHTTLNLQNQGEGDFCIEAWVNVPFSYFFQPRGVGGVIVEKLGAYFLEAIESGGTPPWTKKTKFRAWVWNSGIKKELTTVWKYPLDEWLHVAFQRDQAGYLSLIVNGVQDVISSFTCDPPDVNENDVLVGYGPDGFDLKGDLDEVRLSDCYRDLSTLDPNTWGL